MIELISGALVTMYLVAALIFAKFRRETGDRLFVLFSFAFVLLAVQRMALLFLDGTSTNPWPVYLLRVVAFTLIIVAIIDKNRVERKAVRGPRLVK